MAGEIFSPTPEHIVLDASFRDFHVKGFDYLCLKRSPELTVKVYFFDGELTDLPELVVPHDHRYSFFSSCIDGSATNKKWRAIEPGQAHMWGDEVERYNKMEWRSPLIGGDGFSWAGEVMLRPSHEAQYHPGHRWYTHHSEIHTLRIEKAGTVLMLEQLEDKVPLDQPTQAYKRDIKGLDPTLPDVKGLYEAMPEQHAIDRLNQYVRCLEQLGISRNR